MFFKDIETWDESKLTKTLIIWNVIYAVLAFLAPLITVIVAFATNGNITKRKLPLILIFIGLAIIIAAVKFLSKKIDNISVINLSGDYKKKTQTFKHSLQFVSKSIVPIFIVIASILFLSPFKDMIDFYVKVILISCSFFIAAKIVDSFALAYLEDEVEIRKHRAMDNAAAKRG